MTHPRRWWTSVAVGLVAIAAAGCGPASGAPSQTLVIGGIPDQDLTVLEERFDGVAAYLAEHVGVRVEYRPSTDYAALVTAFRNGDVLLGWFGGLTGVQARLAVPSARAVAQRPIDEQFRSVFIAGSGVAAAGLAQLAGHTFTFGSESSTSGHLMPRYFLRQAGIDPESDLAGPPSYSGSHDRTWKLVESGAFEAGALSEAVWREAVEQGKVDGTRIRVLHTTAPYYDYHWVAHPDLDEVYGEGFTDRIVEALLTMHEDREQAATLERFQTDRFVPTTGENYEAIETVARDLGLIEP